MSLKIVFEAQEPVDIFRADCSCVAGKALCNHNVALLFQCVHYATLNLRAVPPVLSCTESEQRWHKPRTMGVKPGPVNNMVFLSAKPKQFMVADGVRSTNYKAVSGCLPDLDVLKVDEAYQDIRKDNAPLITTMQISVDVPLVHSAYGLVQKGSPISYQLPAPVSRIIVQHEDAPPPPLLPLDGYRLEPTSCQFVPSQQQDLHLQSLVTPLNLARKIEVATREQSNTVEWHRIRKPRITSSKFREICHVTGQSSSENLADRIKKGGVQTAAMKRGLVLEPAAIQEYCRTEEHELLALWVCDPPRRSLVRYIT